jgi:hypothetical protein
MARRRVPALTKLNAKGSITMKSAALIAAGLASLALAPTAQAASLGQRVPPHVSAHVQHMRFTRRDDRRERFERRDRFFGAYWPSYADADPVVASYPPPSEGPPPPPPVAGAPYNAGPVCPVVWRWSKGQASRHSYCD